MGASLAFPMPAWAADNANAQACSNFEAVLANARRNLENPTPWAQDYGQAALDELERRAGLALEALERAEDREDELERALAVDVIGTVGAAVFFALGFSTTIAAAPLVLAGFGFSALVLIAQSYTNDSGPTGADVYNGLGTPGNMIAIVNEMPTEGFWMVGTGVKTFSRYAGRALGVLGIGVSALEAIETAQDENAIEEEVARLKKEFADLQEDLQERREIHELEDLRYASALALIQDLEDTQAAYCGEEDEEDKSGEEAEGSDQGGGAGSDVDPDLDTGGDGEENDTPERPKRKKRGKLTKG